MSIQGKPYTDARASKVQRAWINGFYTSEGHIEDGDNYKDLIDRADKVLAYLQARDESSILVVSHHYFIATVLARVLCGDALTGELLKQFHQRVLGGNASITVLRYEDAFEQDFCWRLLTYNDHAHLL